MSEPMESKNPLQQPRVAEIRAGRKFWGYLDTEVMRSRYALAAHFLRPVRHIVEIGGYRDNVITDFVTTAPESVTVYSLDAEFEERQQDTLHGRPCRVRHIRDFFQAYEHREPGLGLVALGLEIIGDMEPLFGLMRAAQVSVIEIATDHAPSRDMFDGILARREWRVRWQVALDFSSNEAALAAELEVANMNAPFWRRTLYVLEPEP